jgi:hypothetical protein
MLEDKVEKELEDITSERAKEIVNEAGVLLYQGCHLHPGSLHGCFENQKGRGKGCKPDASKNLVNISVKDPDHKALLPWGPDQRYNKPILMDSNEALSQIDLHKPSIKDRRQIASLNVTTAAKNQACVDDLLRMMNKYKSLLEKSEIEKEVWKQKAIMLQQEKERGFNIQTADYDAQQRDMDGTEDVTTAGNNQARVDELVRMLNKATEDATFWRNKAQDLQNEAVEKRDQLGEFAARIVQEASDNLAGMADAYWETFSGTLLAIRENERLEKQIEEYLDVEELLGINDPLNKAHGNELLEEHEDWHYKLCYDLRVLEADLGYGLPDILEDGLPMPKQKWISLFIEDMLSGFSELKTTEEMAHHVSVARDKMALHEFTMHELLSYVLYWYHNEELAKHLSNVSRFLAD